MSDNNTLAVQIPQTEQHSAAETGIVTFKTLIAYTWCHMDITSEYPYGNSSVKRFDIFFHILLNLPCQNVDDDCASNQKWNHGTFALLIDSTKQDHHGDQASHKNLPTQSPLQLTIWFDDVKSCSCCIQVPLRSSHELRNACYFIKVI